MSDQEVAKNDNKQPVAILRTIAILWVIWGLVHVLAGVMTLSKETSAAIAGIADKVPLEEISRDYPGAATAIINHHGHNLLWIGALTTICAFYVWRGSKTGMLFAAISAGMADLGYFIFLDLGGYVNFMPGTLMTIICASAIGLSLWANTRIS